MFVCYFKSRSRKGNKKKDDKMKLQHIKQIEHNNVILRRWTYGHGHRHTATIKRKQHETTIYCLLSLFFLLTLS